MRVAVVPASYDPPTKGHENVIMRASKLFDEVLVVVAVNTDKKAFLSAQTRVDLLKEICERLPNVSVHQTDGLITDFMHLHNSNIIVRGVRTGADLDYERSLESIYQSQMPEIEVVILSSRPALGFISSSAVRSLYVLGGFYANLVPDSVAEHLANPDKHKKIVYLCGNPGCGKTYYRELHKEEFEKQNISYVFDVNNYKDYSLIEKGYTQAQIHSRANRLAFAACEKRIANAESMLCEVTVASMLNEATQDNIRKMRSYGYRVELYLFVDNMDASKERNAMRDYPTPEDKYIDLSDSMVQTEIYDSGLFDKIKNIDCRAK